MIHCKLLLTSSGVKTTAMKSSLTMLLGKPISEASVCYIPTAGFGEQGNDWMVDAVNEARGLGWKSFELADLLATPPDVFFDILDHSDAVFVDGGNVYHLARSIAKSEKQERLKSALITKVYIGVSAGSMIFSRHLSTTNADLFGEGNQTGEGAAEPPFPWFDWYLKPHYLSPTIKPARDQAWANSIARKAAFPIYFVGDQSALEVVDGEVTIIGDTVCPPAS